jgi:hypothetical protein
VAVSGRRLFVDIRLILVVEFVDRRMRCTVLVLLEGKLWVVELSKAYKVMLARRLVESPMKRTREFF